MDTEIQRRESQVLDMVNVSWWKGEDVLVLLSGGQDSTTCLYWAQRAGFANIHAISFDYGQRNIAELKAAKIVAIMAGAKSHSIVPLHNLLDGSTSPLTNPQYDLEHFTDYDSLPNDLEKTFVPGRNILFLSLAASLAYNMRIRHIIIGVSQEELGGYPDCREDFIKAMQESLQKGLDYNLSIHAPLIHADKEEAVRWAYEGMPGAHKPFGLLHALAETQTCYEGTIPPCDVCSACVYRRDGFEKAGQEDPLLSPPRHDMEVVYNYRHKNDQAKIDKIRSIIMERIESEWDTCKMSEREELLSRVLASTWVPAKMLEEMLGIEIRKTVSFTLRRPALQPQESEELLKTDSIPKYVAPKEKQSEHVHPTLKIPTATEFYGDIVETPETRGERK